MEQNKCLLPEAQTDSEVPSWVTGSQQGREPGPSTSGSSASTVTSICHLLHIFTSHWPFVLTVRRLDFSYLSLSWQHRVSFKWDTLFHHVVDGCCAIQANLTCGCLHRAARRRYSKVRLTRWKIEDLIFSYVTWWKLRLINGSWRSMKHWIKSNLIAAVEDSL